MGKVISIVVLLALLSGCATTQPTGSLCTLGPFRPDPGAGDRWTDNEKDQLIVFNESGEKLCGWHP